METKKVVLVGDAMVGKTSLVQKMQGKDMTHYIVTLGVEVQPIVYGQRRYIVWDCAGDPRYRGLGEGYYNQSDIVIIMYKNDLHSTLDWEESVRRVCPNTPIVKCVNHHFNDTFSQVEGNVFHLNTLSGKGIKDLFNRLVFL